MTLRCGCGEPKQAQASFDLALGDTGRIIGALIPVVSTAVTVSELSEPKRITLTLDPGLVLERLILQRLSRLQRKRGQDWLRSLLTQGFLAEGHWIRGDIGGDHETLVPRETTVPATPFANWLERAHPVNRPNAEMVPTAATAVTPTPSASPDAKPFAHLRSVIG